MHHVYVITSGGVWFCESKEYLEYHVAGVPTAEGDRMREVNKATPMHCVIGASGYNKGHGTWPKDGLYCIDCGTISVKTKPA